MPTPWSATRGVTLMLDEVRRQGLPHVDPMTDPDNEPSQKVIRSNGGMFVERFQASAYGKDELRFRIRLA